MPPSKDYLDLLDFKAILREWQDLAISDRAALNKIGTLILNVQKRWWEEQH